MVGSLCFASLVGVFWIYRLISRVPLFNDPLEAGYLLGVFRGRRPQRSKVSQRRFVIFNDGSVCLAKLPSDAVDVLSKVKVGSKAGDICV